MVEMQGTKETRGTLRSGRAQVSEAVAPTVDVRDGRGRGRGRASSTVVRGPDGEVDQWVASVATEGEEL